MDDFDYKEVTRPVYYVKDIAELLCVSKSTVYRWAANKLHLTRIWGRGPLRASRAAMFAFLKCHRPDLIPRFRLTNHCTRPQAARLDNDADTAVGHASVSESPGEGG